MAMASARELAAACQAVPCTAVPVRLADGRVVEFWAMNDAAKVAGVRAMVSANLAQQAADLCGMMLPTARMVDLIVDAATMLVDPMPMPISATPEAAVTHSRRVDTAVGAARGLLSNVGKWWVIDNKLSIAHGRAMNYGWHVRANPWRGIATHPAVSGSWRVIQPAATAHNGLHYDYSQTLRLVRRECTLDGEPADLAQLLADPTCAAALTTCGPMVITRQPGVEPPGVVVLPEVVITASPPKPVAPKPMVAAVAAARAAMGDFEDIRFVPTRQRTAAQRRPDQIRWIVLHTAETGEVPNAAENLAAWVAGPQAPQASWHFAVDCDSIVQSVRLCDVAWHAPGANRDGIGIEQAGRAAQGGVQWEDDYSTRMLERTAQLVARLCRLTGIPVVRLGPSDLVRAGTRGVCGHHDVTLAFMKSTHTDPGAAYPWDRVLGRVRDLLAGG